VPAAVGEQFQELEELLVTRGTWLGAHPGGVWLSQTLKGTAPPEKVTMPCVCEFALTVLGDHEKDTLNGAAATGRPTDGTEGGVPTATTRSRTIQSPTLKTARHFIIRARCFFCT